MRCAFLSFLATALLAAPALGVGFDPSALVLAARDAPGGFVLDRDDSGVRTNEDEAEGNAKTRALIARMGRVTGYETQWEQEPHRFPLRAFVSRADVFRDAEGARMYVRFASGQFSRSGIKGLDRRPVRIGEQGWVLSGGGAPDGVVWVVWRSGRVAGSIAGWNVARNAVVVLARKQQRRIAAALR
jgi:hypothetical protein